ncbi:hypothetical protein Tco_1062459 [Tanacetum coccineum]
MKTTGKDLDFRIYVLIFRDIFGQGSVSCLRNMYGHSLLILSFTEEIKGMPYLNGKELIRNSKSDDRHLGGFKEPNIPLPANALVGYCTYQQMIYSVLLLGKIKVLTPIYPFLLSLTDELRCIKRSLILVDLVNDNNSFVSDIRLVWIAIEGSLCRACSVARTEKSVLTYQMNFVESSSMLTFVGARKEINNSITGDAYDHEAGQDSVPSHPLGFTQEISLALKLEDQVMEFVIENLVGSRTNLWDYNMAGGKKNLEDCRLLHGDSCFVKDNATISDYFVAVRGTWLSTATKLFVLKASFRYRPIIMREVVRIMGLSLFVSIILVGLQESSVVWILDKLFDNGLSNEELVTERISLLKELHNFNKSHSLDLAQKAKGIRFDDSLTLSHLFYADDAVFIGKWDRANILPSYHYWVFYFFHPFSYLGVKVGIVSPSRRKAWDEIIGKVSNRLSKWKIKTLSIGGRLTLIKSVLTSLPLYHMSLYKAPLGVLRDLESLRRKNFNGADINEKRFSMIRCIPLASSYCCFIWQSFFFCSHRFGFQFIPLELYLERAQFLSPKGIKPSCAFEKESRKRLRTLSSGEDYKLIDASFLLLFVETPVEGWKKSSFTILVELCWVFILSPSNVRYGHMAFLDLLMGESGSNKGKYFRSESLFGISPRDLTFLLRGIDIPSIICPNCVAV